LEAPRGTPFKNKDELIIESAKILHGQYRKVIDQGCPQFRSAE